ncbi:MAG TPA: CGNR zinc finger domain-containing protein [Gemmatimonadales bacterium]|nr:CGNR zinc finger domain-containing protein [Gemmatimonadales bacterium]
MTDAPPPALLPFAYVGGDPSLDLVNTADWTHAGPFRDRLGGYERFTEWAEGAGVLTRRDGERLRAAARAHPRRAAAAFARVREVRRVLQALFTAAAAGAVPESLLAQLNSLLPEALARLELTAKGSRVQLAWRGLGDDLTAPLWPVVWAAARLLDSAEAARLRVCSGVECGWVYVDRSRNGMRRWCEMATCGTSAKNRRRRARRQSAAAE